jgi:hypothetical protein
VRRRPGALAVAAALALALPQAFAAERSEPAVWTTHALVKVRPFDPPAGPEPVRLQAARNEFEAFQLVVQAGDAPLRRVDVEAGDLLAAGGAGRIDRRHVGVYLELYQRLQTPSSRRGEAGEWPDPLLPRVDPYAGERRAAFPFEVGAGRNQPLWIELYVPLDAPPGLYCGALRVTLEERAPLAVPWCVDVWPFALPSTASLRSSYGFSGPAALRRHRGGSGGERELLELTELYTRAALRHRLSLHGGSFRAPPATFEGAAATVDWRDYDAEVAAALDGRLFGPAAELPGARATSIDARLPPGLDERQKILYWRAWTRHFRERGWLDRLFVYLWDEPDAADYPSVLEVARLARRADPALPTLLTEPLVPALVPAVDLWVPLVNCFEPTGAATCGGAPVGRRAYRRAEERGGRVWWYQSCASHGCDGVGGREFDGWPSYAVDAPALAHRVLPWLAWRYGIEGELYFNTVEAYADGPDPWRDARRHGGNGDGTLFYPGTPARIGGSTHVPVESLRLKQIRDGLEDFEYLALASGTEAARQARSWAAFVAQRTDRWQRRPEALLRARTAIGRALARQEAQGG